MPQTSCMWRSDRRATFLAMVRFLIATTQPSIHYSVQSPSSTLTAVACAPSHMAVSLCTRRVVLCLISKTYFFVQYVTRLGLRFTPRLVICGSPTTVVTSGVACGQRGSTRNLLPTLLPIAQRWEAIGAAAPTAQQALIVYQVGQGRTRCLLES